MLLCNNAAAPFHLFLGLIRCSWLWSCFWSWSCTASLLFCWLSRSQGMACFSVLWSEKEHRVGAAFCPTVLWDQHQHHNGTVALPAAKAALGKRLHLHTNTRRKNVVMPSCCFQSPLSAGITASTAWLATARTSFLLGSSVVCNSLLCCDGVCPSIACARWQARARALLGLEIAWAFPCLALS